MPTLAGDLLRYLVRGGTMAAGNLLGQIISEPLKERRQQKAITQRAEIGELLGMAKTADEAALPNISELLKKKGFEGGLPTYTADGVQKYIRPPVGINELIAVEAQKRPAILESILNIKGGAQTEQQKVLAELAGQKQDALNFYRDARMDIDRQKLENHFQTMRDRVDITLQKLAFDREKFEHTQTKKADKEKTDAEKLEEQQYMHHHKLLTDRLKMTDKQKNDPETVLKAAQEYNTLLESVPEKLKSKFAGFQPFEITPAEPGWLGTSIGAKKSQVKAPTAGAVPEREPTGATPAASDLLTELKRRAAANDKAAQTYLKNKGLSWQ